MIRFLSRFLGLWLVAGALAALVVDATKSIAASRLIVTPLGVAWSNVSVSSLMGFQEFVQRSIEPTTGRWLWDPVLQGLLLLPTWVLLGALGFLFTWLGSRRSRMKDAFA